MSSIKFPEEMEVNLLLEKKIESPSLLRPWDSIGYVMSLLQKIISVKFCGTIRQFPVIANLLQ